MSTPDTSTDRDYTFLKNQWMAQAEQAFERMFGPQHQAQLVSFAQREDRAVQLGRRLTQWLLEEHAGADAAAQPSAQHYRPLCPRCQRPAQRVTASAQALPQRTVQTRAGPVDLEREQYQCTICRIVFFPLGPEAATGDRRL